jgi:hypothetical protein
MTIYFISGLGADERVFQFLDIPGVEKKFIRWIEPGKDESIHNYALRLTEQIERSKDIVLLGISFGGLIAQEISTIIHCKKVILVSTIRSEHELSLPMKLVRLTRVDKLFPATFLKWSNKFTADYFIQFRLKAVDIL